jgi:hypothetical protein
MEFEIPYKLEKAISENRLLIFIGAGISKSAGLPLWREIVIETLQDPAIAKGQDFINAIEAEILTPLEALDKIQQKNRREVYKTFEEKTSDKIESNLYKKIADISRRIITTNYDSLIEYNTKIQSIDTSSNYNLQKLDDLDEFVLKIHGSCTAIDKAIIFSTDYEDLYGPNGDLAKFQLEKLITSHSCLFLGFSMNDNYVKTLLDRLNQLYGELGKEHFIISSDNINHGFVTTINIKSHSNLSSVLDKMTLLKNLRNSSNLKEESLLNVAHAAAENTKNAVIEDGIVIHNGHDKPPKIENWTGRSEELKSLMTTHKICFITGIGGQGKSALASKVLAEAEKETYQFRDWRDFKEETLNFQNKLYQLVELVSDGRRPTKQLVGLETESLIEIFFSELGNQKGLFVFDNIDRYIDLQKFTPSGEMYAFFNKALKSPHSSKFIFTCRPFIHFAGIGFYQVKLEGLEFEDTKELIKKYHQQLKDSELHRITVRLHHSTNGHPLWMGLILAQSRTDFRQIESILSKIESSQTNQSENNLSSLISESILENVWTGLKDREKVILRTLSISSISETEEDLAKILSQKINYNQFTKALRSLKTLNLIVAKEGEGYIELHPLVREFIKVNYGREEQESYIALYVSYLDGFIVLLKNRMGKFLESSDIDVISKKIEILINTDNAQESINELRRTSGSFQVSGYNEEFLRLADLLLRKNIWTYKKLMSLHGFSEFMSIFFARASEFGQHEMFDEYMAKYLDVFKEPDANMILAKSAICYNEWTMGNFKNSITEGKSASDLIDLLEENDLWAGKSRYHLALRDSKEIANIEKALDYFCERKNLPELRSGQCTSENSSQYGNIGRCLLYLNQHSEALYFIAKSYKSLNENKASNHGKHNLGYASKWIGEILADQQTGLESLYFFLHARNIWKNEMPGEANKIDSLISTLSDTISKQSVMSLESWQITKFCDTWIDGHYSKHTD